MTEPARRPAAPPRGPRPRGGALLLALALAAALPGCRKPEEQEAPVAAPSATIKAPPLPETIHEAWRGPSFEASAAPSASGKAAPKVSALRGGIVVIEAGQHVYLEARAAGGRITLVREVDNASAAPLVIDLSLRETEGGTTLAVQNPFPQWLSYRAAATVATGKAPAPRVSCTIGSLLEASETWTEKVTKLSITGFTLADKPTPCVR
jgi:hypothetical protein